MDRNVYPCIIYQRLRPSAPEASQLAVNTIWPLVDEIVARENYTPCGLYGDSEFARPFCGGSEIRPGFERALQHARKVAANLGLCTLLVGDGSAIGDGDPFLPVYNPIDANAGIYVRVANFHLRPHAQSTSLRSAWRCVEDQRRREAQVALVENPIMLEDSTDEFELLVRRDPHRLLARLYFASNFGAPVRFKWRRLVRRDGAEPSLEESAWSSVEVASGSAVYLDTVFQGELPWVKQLRIRHQAWGHKVIGTAHITPSDMLRDRLPLIWEDQA